MKRVTLKNIVTVFLIIMLSVSFVMTAYASKKSEQKELKAIDTIVSEKYGADYRGYSFHEELNTYLFSYCVAGKAAEYEKANDGEPGPTYQAVLEEEVSIISYVQQLRSQYADVSFGIELLNDQQEGQYLFYTTGYTFWSALNKYGTDERDTQCGLGAENSTVESTPTDTKHFGFDIKILLYLAILCVAAYLVVFLVRNKNSDDLLTATPSEVLKETEKELLKTESDTVQDKDLPERVISCEQNSGTSGSTAVLQNNDEDYSTAETEAQIQLKKTESTDSQTKNEEPMLENKEIPEKYHFVEDPIARITETKIHGCQNEEVSLDETKLVTLPSRFHETTDKEETDRLERVQQSSEEVSRDVQQETDAIAEEIVEEIARKIARESSIVIGEETAETRTKKAKAKKIKEKLQAEESENVKSKAPSQTSSRLVNIGKKLLILCRQDISETDDEELSGDRKMQIPALISIGCGLIGAFFKEYALPVTLGGIVLSVMSLSRYDPSKHKMKFLAVIGAILSGFYFFLGLVNVILF